jgi:hypothetical protein
MLISRFSTFIALATASLSSACEVSVGNCERDGGDCLSDFPSFDAAVIDGSIDATVVTSNDAGSRDASPADASSAPDAGEPPAGKSLAEFCAELSSKGLAWASSLDSCCPNPQDRQSEAAATILNLIGAYSETSVDRCIEFYSGLQGAGAVTLQLAYASSCATQYLAAFPMAPDTCPTVGFDVEQLRSTVGHGAQQLVQIASCRQALVGSKKMGDACTRDVECSAPLTCVPLATNPSQSSCGSPRLSGEQCESGGDCAPGLTCVGSSQLGRTCRAVQDLVDFGRCESSVECVQGKVCAGGSCVSPEPGSIICR